MGSLATFLHNHVCLCAYSFTFCDVFFCFFLQEWGPKVILFYAQNNSRNESV